MVTAKDVIEEANKQALCLALAETARVMLGCLEAVAVHGCGIPLGLVDPMRQLQKALSAFDGSGPDATH